MSATSPVQRADVEGRTGTAAEIAAAIELEGRTRKDIDLGDLLWMMNFRGMLTKAVGNDAAKKWSGSVLDMKVAVEASNDAEALLAIEQWLSHITNTRNSTWQTSKADYAAPFWGLYQIFNNPPNDQIFNTGDLDAIYELGGGRITATEAEVQTILDEIAAEAAAEAADAQRVAAINNAQGRDITTAAEWAQCWTDASS